MISKTIRNASAFVVLVMLITIIPAQAATLYWTNTAANATNAASSWSPAQYPAAADNLFFTNNAAYQVAWTGTVSATTMNYDGTSGIVTNNMLGTNNLTGSIMIGNNAGSTATVVQVGSGLISQTGGLAIELEIGHNGVGSFTLDGSRLRAANVYVGNNTANNLFVVTNGAFLNVNGAGTTAGTYFGVGSASTGNTMIVTGLGTIWTNTGRIVVGYVGQGNTLRIADGASVISAGLMDLGWFAASSSNNTVMVTGSNSYLEVGSAAGAYLQIGEKANNNSLIVSNGGSLRVLKEFYVGGTSGSFLTTNNNTIVTGAGSIVSNTSTLFVGYAGGGNTLRIEDGARMISGDSVTMGYTATSSNNTVLVTGTNSFWGITANDFLQVGRLSVGNKLIVSNGATVKFDGTNVFLGNSGANNRITVTGAGSVFSNAAALFYAGYNSAGNRLLIENGGTLVSSNMIIDYFGLGNNAVTVSGPNSLLTVLDSLLLQTTSANLTITNGGAVVANQLTLQNNTLKLVGGSLETHGSTANGTTVVGGGPDTATWTMLGGSNTFGGVLAIANNGSLLATNGAYVKTTGFRVGANVGETNGLAVLTGPGTLLTNTSNAYVGYNTGAAGNTLRIENGARVVSTAALDLGISAGSSNNTVTVTGTNSSLEVSAGYVQIGQGDNNNSVIVSNGGSMRIAAPFYIGGTAAGITTNNNATITGAGSVLSNTTAMYVGYTGGGNTLKIENGARMVSAGSVIMAQTATASNNVAVVSGTNSMWDASPSTLYLGYIGGGNSVLLTNGGRLLTTTTYLGGDNAASVGGNKLTASGAGTIWTNSGALQVGSYGAVNTLRVEDGARVISAGALDLGLRVNSSNNTVTVTGTNSYFQVSSVYAQIGGGLNANNNSVIVSNGGSMRIVAPFYVGGAGLVFSTNNNAIVTGAGSVLSNTTTLFVGYSGSGDTLQIDNGGRMVSGGALDLGFNGGASNNTVLVTGTNSYFEVSSGYVQLGAGASAHNNRIIVSNGGSMRIAPIFYLGSTASSSTNNATIVTGAGSVLSNTTAATIIGYNGGGNTLRIENGAKMASIATGVNSSLLGILVGRVAAASNNTIIVTGSNTVWGITASGTNPEFTLGYGAGGNTMLISNGAKVRFDGTYFEIGNVTANNVLTITGAGSTFSNPAANFYVGANAGVDNRMSIDNGGQLYTSNLIVSTGTGNRIQVLSGGLLDANILNLGAAANNMTNFGGIYQFTTATPTITKSGSNIILTNGTVSFRNVAAADVKGNWTGSQLTNIAFQGDNTFRLNNSSNSTSGQDYTFNTGLGATNYTRLEMMNGNTAWRSSQLTVGSGGTFLASNTVGTVAAVITNLGNIEVKNSMMTWSSNVVINGRYVSDPSTNTYFGDVTIGQSGTLAGGAGDLFDFKKSLFINSTNQIGFQLATSAVKFSGGGMHTNALTGADLGSDIGAYSSAFEIQTNFAYGELHLGSVTDQVCFTCGILPAPAVTNIGLYIGWLDLLGNSALVTNLHAASGITLYYEATDTRNAYLNNLTYSLTDCDFAPGGGFLMPIIPEPSALAFILAAAGLFLRRKSQRS